MTKLSKEEVQGKAQKLYERLNALRADRAAKIRERKESLENIPRYADIKKEAQALAEQRKSVEKDWEGQNDGIMTEIDSLKTKVESAEFALAGAMLEAWREGHSVELTKVRANGEKKKVGYEFKLKFIQPSLFDGA